MNHRDQGVPEQRATLDAGEIMVATDGSAAAGVAVQYALGLAVETGAAVRIVHVVPSHLPVPPGFEEAVMQAGAELLADVSRRARLAAPRVDVRATLLEGARGLQLVAAAHSAGLVVLGRRARSGHLLTGSMASALVEHTRCPVRVVPPDWFKPQRRSEVVVGVKDPTTASSLVARAFRVAEDLGQSLVLLHAWGLPSGYEEVMERADTDSWNGRLAAQIEAAARAVRDDRQDVPYQIRVVHGRPAQALEAASRRAAFLLLGRTTHHNPVGLRAGVSHLLMQLSECPVEIGPEPRPVVRSAGVGDLSELNHA